MENNKASSSVNIASFFSKIICPNGRHIRMHKYRCNRCSVYCKKCKYPISYIYICTYCQKVSCAIHYQTHSSSQLFNCSTISHINQWIEDLANINYYSEHRKMHLKQKLFIMHAMEKHRLLPY